MFERPPTSPPESQTAPAPAGDATAALPAEAAAQRLLGFSVEIAGTRACLIEPVAGQYRVVGWINLARGRDSAMPDQVAETCRRLAQRLGSVLWDEELNAPFTRTISRVRYPPIDQVAGSISARPPLRVVVAGLSRGGSIAAARAAIASAPCTLVGELVYDASVESAQVKEFLEQTLPDALVLTGGFDDERPAAQAAVLALSRAAAQGTSRLPRSRRPLVLYAGNRAATAAVEPLFRTGDSPAFDLLENVLPEPGLRRRAGLAQALTFAYWRLMQRLVGFKEVTRWVTEPGYAATVETRFIQLLQAWALRRELADLHGVYCGPAWWLHAWVNRERGEVQIHYAEPGTLDRALEGWPAPRFVSGEWPAPWPHTANAWWDRAALAPAVAGLGQTAPHALIQVLETDVVRTLRAA